MNIDKVNATLSRALTQIQEGETERLREFAVAEAEAEDESTKFEAVIEALADKLVQEAGIDDEVAITAIVEVAGSMAESGELPELLGLDAPTEEDVDAWLSAVENSSLVENTLRHIASS